MVFAFLNLIFSLRIKNKGRNRLHIVVGSGSETTALVVGKILQSGERNSPTAFVLVLLSRPV